MVGLDVLAGCRLDGARHQLGRQPQIQVLALAQAGHELLEALLGPSETAQDQLGLRCSQHQANVHGGLFRVPHGRRLLVQHVEDFGEASLLAQRVRPGRQREGDPPDVAEVVEDLDRADHGAFGLLEQPARVLPARHPDIGMRLDVGDPHLDRDAPGTPVPGGRVVDQPRDPVAPAEQVGDGGAQRAGRQVLDQVPRRHQVLAEVGVVTDDPLQLGARQIDLGAEQIALVCAELLGQRRGTWPCEGPWVAPSAGW